MQVNSAQDWVTSKKRSIIAKTYQTTPPPQSRKTNSVYLSTVANGATQRQRFVAPFQGANGGASGGATYSSLCCLSGVPGVFSTVNNQGIVRFNVIPPISVTATRVATG
jgi:hypothetical protein